MSGCLLELQLHSGLEKVCVADAIEAIKRTIPVHKLKP
jgi:hypothetical protein